jgi:hypothetical protein
LKREELAFAGMDAADGEHDDFGPSRSGFRRHHGKIRTEGSGRQHNLVGGFLLVDTDQDCLSPLWA